MSLDRLDLSGGQYFVNVGLYPQDWAYAYDYHWHVYPLELRLAASRKGIIHPPHHWLIDHAKLPHTPSIFKRSLPK